MHLTADTLKDLPRQQRVNLINSLSGFKSANLLGTRAANGQETFQNKTQYNAGNPHHSKSISALKAWVLK